MRSRPVPPAASTLGVTETSSLAGMVLMGLLPSRGIGPIRQYHEPNGFTLPLFSGYGRGLAAINATDGDPFNELPSSRCRLLVTPCAVLGLIGRDGGGPLWSACL